MLWRVRLFHTILVFVVSLLVESGISFAASPVLNTILPRGGQRGTEQVLVFSGERLDDALDVFAYEPGFTVTKIERQSASRLRVHLKISPTCRLGEHALQVRTKSGISGYHTFFVGALPTVDEKEPNSDFEKPQPIKLNVTIRGIVQQDDIDYFVIEATKGQRITAEIEGVRLGSARFDPNLGILDSKRRELSVADDTALFWQDCVVSVIAPADGKYIIRLREGAYFDGLGQRFRHYRLHIGTFPRPTAVYPAGGKVGEKIEVRFLGDVGGEIKRTITVPNEPADPYISYSYDYGGVVQGLGLFVQDAGGIAPSSNPFRPFAYGNIFEVEPNDSVKQATSAKVPSAFNGIISKPGDIDHFRFPVRKGQVYDIECYARRVRSPLDSVMVIHNTNGGRIAGSDDSHGGRDSFIRFRAPANGDYIVSVTDLLHRGGVNFTYRIEVTTAMPSLILGIPQPARNTQKRQTIVVPRGNRFATLVSALRSNVEGELVLEAHNLPRGLKMVAQPMASNLNVMPVVFEAAADAPISGQLIDLTAHSTDAQLKVRGRFRNTAGMTARRFGGTTVIWSKRVEKLAVAVVEELPFRLEILQPKVPLVRNGALQLKIIAHREKGFDAPINVLFPFRPPGVGAAMSVEISKGKSEAFYSLDADSGAQIRKWPVYVIGSVNLGVRGTAWVSSQLATVEIAAPYVQITTASAQVEQGQKTNLICEVQLTHPFPGKAKAKLLGLPYGVTAPELEFTTTSKELVFPVKADAASHPGWYRNIFCQVIVTENGERIVHRRVGKVELRINQSLPTAKKK